MPKTFQGRKKQIANFAANQLTSFFKIDSIIKPCESILNLALVIIFKILYYL